MLNVNEYINTVRQFERQIEEYKLRMEYRKLELGFHTEYGSVVCNGRTYTSVTASCNITGSINSNDSDSYKADAEYANLKYKYEILNKKLNFLKEHGCLPDEN